MRTGGGGQVPWPVIAVIVLAALFLLNGAVGLLLPLLIGGAGAWLALGGIRAVRGQRHVTYWRGQRLELEAGARGERLARALFAIALGAALVAFAVWYLLLRH